MVPSPTGEAGLFRDCILIPEGTSVRKLSSALGLQRDVMFAHTVDGNQIGAGEIITPKHSILKLTLSAQKKDS